MPIPVRLRATAAGSGRRLRTRQRRRADPVAEMAGTVGIAGIGAGAVRCGGFAVRGTGDIFGAHQSLDHVHRTVVADGDDGARHLPVLAAEHGAVGHGAFDFLQTRLDALVLRFECLGPVPVMEFAEFVAPGGQFLGFLRFGRGRLAGLRADASESRRVAPFELDAGLGPGPLRSQFLRGGLQPVQRQLSQQRRVVEPGARLVLLGEQIPRQRAAGFFVGGRADELCDGGSGRDPALVQEPADLPHARAVVLGLQFLPHRELKLGVGGGAERLQALEPHVPGPVGFEEFRRGVAEAQAPFHGALADAEPRGDLRDRRAVAGQLRERLHLVGRVHGDAHDGIFRQRQFRGGAGARQYLAGDGMIGLERTVVGQRLQSRQAPAAGDNLEAVWSSSPSPSAGCTRRFSSRPWAAMEALSWSNARPSAGVFRTFWGEGISEWRGMHWRVRSESVMDNSSIGPAAGHGRNGNGWRAGDSRTSTARPEPRPARTLGGAGRGGGERGRSAMHGSDVSALGHRHVGAVGDDQVIEQLARRRGPGPGRASA